VEDMVRQSHRSHSSAEKFIISNVTQLFERRQVWRAAPLVPRARSPAVTTYAAGPMTDPWIMLALMSSSEDSSSQNTVQWEWLAKKSTSQLEWP